MSVLRLSILLAIAGVVLIAGVGVASADIRRREVVQWKAVTVELTYRRVHDKQFDIWRFENVRLRILRRGHPVVSEHVPDPAEFYAQHKSIAIDDVDGDAVPEVLYHGFTGGAHCCSQLYIYRLAYGKYQRAVGDFGNPGYQIRDLNGDGKAEFLSADNRFAYAFSSYASSGLPIRVYKFRSGHFIPITRRFPQLIKEDAALWWRSYQRNKVTGSVRGALAAWAADQCLLGAGEATVIRVLRAAAARGELRGETSTDPSPTTYIYQLRRNLAEWGYLGVCGR